MFPLSMFPLTRATHLGIPFFWAATIKPDRDPESDRLGLAVVGLDAEVPPEDQDQQQARHPPWRLLSSFPSEAVARDSDFFAVVKRRFTQRVSVLSKPWHAL